MSDLQLGWTGSSLFVSFSQNLSIQRWTPLFSGHFYYFIIIALIVLVINSTILILGISGLFYILTVIFSNFYCHPAEGIITCPVTATL